MRYRVDLSPDDNETLLVTCPALPMVVTFGDDRSSALDHALDAIETVLASMIDDQEPIPLSEDLSDGTGDFVTLSSQTALKVQLYQSMRDGGLSRSGLSERLGWSSVRVDQIFDLSVATPLGDFDAAFAALGKRVRAEAIAA